MTTFFDLYKLDKRFPAFEAASNQNQLARRLQLIEEALHQDIINYADCRPERFIPYIQPYEFEALLFSNVEELTKLESEWFRAKDALLEVRAKAETPELINDKPETKPAAHLERELTSPKYRKRRHGPIAAQKIGLSKIEAECAFFAAWLNKIRSLT